MGFVSKIKAHYEPKTAISAENYDNEKCADRIDKIIMKYMQLSPVTDRGDAIADIITDLMHWADKNKIDFGAELNRAQTNYKSDKEEE